MADKNVTVDPRYLKYNKDEVKRILESVEEFDAVPTENSDKPVKSGGVAAATKAATEESVRNIVKNWTPEEPEPGE